MTDPTLAAQLDFLLSCDRLKSVVRTTRLHDGSRPENSAEHSWHLALMALTLAEYAPAGTDMAQVVRLLLVHDLVEIGAGDLHFDAQAEALAAQAAAEAKAAKQLFGLLPEPQAAKFTALWQEYEVQRTPESRFAKALDSLQPMLLTWGQTADGAGGLGCAGAVPELTVRRVLKLKRSALADFPQLWQAAERLLQEAERAGVIQP
ncbi:HD domain-containing protein [Deinococcus sp. Marseille-Q6407]|uniref:HD domain-containing protein n=1 Tax=Deinococcus sp. Marseille-Q6407 TaxID=2969223 RepID=UPI0021BFBA27|nr:HD domain-containing protein [Deinococcus sp. Marseille-Q6407]